MTKIFKSYLTAAELSEVAQSVQVNFEFNLTTRSTIHEVAAVVKEELQDRNWPTRPSLCLAIAKLAQALWVETCHATATR